MPNPNHARARKLLAPTMRSYRLTGDETKERTAAGFENQERVGHSQGQRAKGQVTLKCWPLTHILDVRSSRKKPCFRTLDDANIRFFINCPSQRLAAEVAAQIRDLNDEIGEIRRALQPGNHNSDTSGSSLTPTTCPSTRILASGSFDHLEPAPAEQSKKCSHGQQGEQWHTNDGSGGARCATIAPNSATEFADTPGQPKACDPGTNKDDMGHDDSDSADEMHRLVESGVQVCSLVVFLSQCRVRFSLQFIHDRGREWIIIM